MRRFYHPHYLLILLLLITFRAQAQEEELLFPRLDEVLYQDQAHAYDDAAVIVLSKKKIPTVTSRLIPVQKGDIINLESYVHYTRNGSKNWQKMGTVAAGLAIGSLPYLLDQNTSNERANNNSFLKKAAPLAGVGVASIPFVLDKRRRPTRHQADGFALRNGWLVPNAYLKYTLYDNQGVLLTSSYEALDKTAKNSWQKLSLVAEVTQNGYMTIEMGNQSKRPVWFDQFETVHRSRVDTSSLQSFEGLPIGGDTLQANSTPMTKYICWLIIKSVNGLVIDAYTDCGYYDPGDPHPPGPPLDNLGDDPFEECTLRWGDADYCDCVVNNNCSDDQDPLDPPPGDYGGSSGGPGAFDVTSLSSSQKEELENVVETMSENCFYDAMVKHLYLNPKVKTNSSQPSPGGYSGISNTITFKSTNNINLPTAAAEIFHAYQQQHTNRLDNIQRDPNGVGRPNVEFEEKFMALVAGYIEYAQAENQPAFLLPGEFPGMEGVSTWVSSIVDANGGTFPASFTSAQQAQYATYLRSFQAYHANPFSPNRTPQYGTPLDTSPSMMKPTTTFEILGKSDC